MRSDIKTTPSAACTYALEGLDLDAQVGLLLLLESSLLLCLLNVETHVLLVFNAIVVFRAALRGKWCVSHDEVQVAVLVSQPANQTLTYNLVVLHVEVAVLAIVLFDGDPVVGHGGGVVVVGGEMNEGRISTGSLYPISISLRDWSLWCGCGSLARSLV